MVRDILVDIESRDIKFTDRRDLSVPCFDVVWGEIFDDDEDQGLICNIIIPQAYWDSIQYDENNKFSCYFNSPYTPETTSFNIRLLKLTTQGYARFDTIRGNYGLKAYSYAFDKMEATELYPCQMPFINLDGEFQVELIKDSASASNDKAFVYSASVTDFEIGFSDSQSGQLLSLCSAGRDYRYPTIGVGITEYLNGVVEHSDLLDKIKAQFLVDNKIVDEAYFDPSTGACDVRFNPEEEQPLDKYGEPDESVLSMFTDEYIRGQIPQEEYLFVDPRLLQFLTIDPNFKYSSVTSNTGWYYR